jgi:hypothetical protein
MRARKEDELPLTRDEMDSFIRLFATYRGEEREEAIDRGMAKLKELLDRKKDPFREKLKELIHPKENHVE